MFHGQHKQQTKMSEKKHFKKKIRSQLIILYLHKKLYKFRGKRKTIKSINKKKIDSRLILIFFFSFHLK